MPSPLQSLLIKLYEWLASTDSSGDGDLIFALAGRQSRKSFALEMFSQGRAPQLLLSVGRFEVRRCDDLGLSVRLNLRQRAASVAPMQRYFFVYLANSACEVEFIDRGRFGTLSEIRALKTWIAARTEIKTILIVSSAAHLRRVRLCCRSVLPASVHFRLLAAKGDGRWLQADSWWRTSETRSIVLCEFPKLVLYWLVLHFRPMTWNAAPRFRNYYETVIRKRSSVLNGNGVCVSTKASWERTNVGGQIDTAGSWRWLVFVLFCSAIIVLSFHRTFLLMVDTWYRSRTYSHCFLILPLFVYLVWLRRKTIAGLKPVPNCWGLPLLGGLAFIWVLGNLGEVKVIQELCVISILITLIWTLLGTAVVRALAFPLLFLFFAVPFGTSLIRPLQDFTAWFVIHALTISNVPAVMENHTISLPSGVWTVAEACSGIRFLLSSVVVGTVFSFLAYQSRKRRLIFLCASIAVPIIGNGLRAYGIIVLAYLTNDRVAAGVDHIVYGGLFSVFLQLVLIVVGLRWRQIPEPTKRIAQKRLAGVPPEPNEHGWPSKTTFFLVAAASAMIVLAPVVAGHLWNRATGITDWTDPPVIVTAPWRLTADGDMSWAPEWHGTDKEFSQSYRYESNKVDLYWVLYSGRGGVDLVTPSDGIANTKSWVLAPDGIGNAVVGGQRIRVQRSMMESGRVTRSVWTWYWVGGEYTADPARVRFLQAKARFLGKPAAVAVISLGADNRTDGSDTARTLQEFLLHASFPIGSPPIS